MRLERKCLMLILRFLTIWSKFLAFHFGFKLKTFLNNQIYFFRYPYLSFREIVLNRKKPRKLFVEASTFVENNEVVLKSYESTHEGVIQSFIDHIDDPKIDDIVIELWKKDAAHFVSS